MLKESADICTYKLLVLPLQKIQSMTRQAQKGKVPSESEKTGLLTYLLSQPALTPTEVVGTVTDLLTGAVETVRPYENISCMKESVA